MGVEPIYRLFDVRSPNRFRYLYDMLPTVLSRPINKRGSSSTIQSLPTKVKGSFSTRRRRTSKPLPPRQFVNRLSVLPPYLLRSENFSGQRISTLPDHTRSSAMPYSYFRNLRLVSVNLDGFNLGLVLSFLFSYGLVSSVGLGANSVSPQ